MTTYLTIGAVWAIINAVMLVAARLGYDDFVETIVNDAPCRFLILMFVIMVLLWPVLVVTNTIGFIKK